MEFQHICSAAHGTKAGKCFAILDFLKHLCVVQFDYIALYLVVIILSYEKYVFAALNVSALCH